MKSKVLLLILLSTLFSHIANAKIIDEETGKEITLTQTTDGYMAFSDEINANIDNLKKHTVIVMKRVYTETGIDYYRGSGIAVDKRHILTAFHVIDNELKHDSYYFANEESNPYTLNVIKQDPLHDLALLEIDKSAPDLIAEPLPFAKDIAPDERVYTVGHPKGKLYQLTTGRVDSLTGKGYEGIQSIELDMNIKTGNSGGTVINDQGEIVGMIFSAQDMVVNMAFMIGKDDIMAFIRS